MNPLTHQPDPYNFPMPNRMDSMSLAVINEGRDGERTHTKKFNSGRIWNDSLKTNDIQGKNTLLNIRCLAQALWIKKSEQARVQQSKLGH
jgi:hypothetical protein